MNIESTFTVLRREQLLIDHSIHPRVYKPAYPQEQARDMIVSGACGVFHPLLLACIAQLLWQYFMHIFRLLIAIFVLFTL